MALQDNSIGAHDFITLLGEVVPPSFQVFTEDRPGVDGTEFIIGGNKGRPFSLVSQVDCASYTAAVQEFQQYLALKVAAPVQLVQGGVNFLTYAFMVKVVNVELIPGSPKTIRGAVGNKRGASPNQGFLECRWDLVAVPI
jgi:hypothetical protein